MTFILVTCLEDKWHLNTINMVGWDLMHLGFKFLLEYFKIGDTLLFEFWGDFMIMLLNGNLLVSHCVFQSTFI